MFWPCPKKRDCVVDRVCWCCGVLSSGDWPAFNVLRVLYAVHGFCFRIAVDM